MAKDKSKKIKRQAAKAAKLPMSLFKKIILAVLAAAVVVLVIYLLYYAIHFVSFRRYKDFLHADTVNVSSPYAPMEDTMHYVPGYELAARSSALWLYTEPKTASVAVYDEITGQVTYSNPVNADEDTVANKANKNFLKSQFILTYFNSDNKSANYDSYSQSVAKGQFDIESIDNGVRYNYRIGELVDSVGNEGISFEISLDYRVEDDHLEVTVPLQNIVSYGGGRVGSIQLLRYFGASSYDDEGYILVPNGSGSLIRFNNGKAGAAQYSQYVYDMDPLAATYTKLENTSSVRLPVFGICYSKSHSILGTIEDGACLASISANVSGAFNDYNYVYPTFLLRTTDNLRNFGDSTQDVLVLEGTEYDTNLRVRYSFPQVGGSDDWTYAGLATYYRDRLVQEGTLTQLSDGADTALYYDVLAGVHETAHFLGVQYRHAMAETTFDEAAGIAEDLAASGVNSQVMNLQGWMNGGYYHNAANHINIQRNLGGKKDLEALQDTMDSLGGRLYCDVAFQNVTDGDKGFSATNEGSRYYGAGFVASFGQTSPTTYRSTANLGYVETAYTALSPKFLPRYVDAFADKINRYDIDGIGLRDLADTLYSDKRRTEIINRVHAQQIVERELAVLDGTGKRLLSSYPNSYALSVTDDIINAPVAANAFPIVDDTVPFYGMVLHGYIPYATSLMNFEDSAEQRTTILEAIESGASPHFVFTAQASNEMKKTSMNRYYATTYDTWKAVAIDAYEEISEALNPVAGAHIVGHTIDGDVRSVLYDNGITIYVNYGDEDAVMDGVMVTAGGYAEKRKAKEV